MTTQTVINETRLAPEIASNLGTALGRAAALSNQPYQAYSGERIAQFAPLQTQAFGSAANLGPTAALGQAQGALTGIMGALPSSTAYNPLNATTQRWTDPGVSTSYMSPYMQDVVDIEKREAVRTDDIARQQRNAQAVRAGAFGGSRQAIVEAEAGRNLQRNLADIQTRGLQAAYDRGAQIFGQDETRQLQATQLGEQSRQFGAGFGLQGLQTGIDAARTAGQLGTNEFDQSLQAINAQSQLGGVQQSQMQNILSQQYQDFLNQQRHPYQQLAFYLDAIQGTAPMMSSTTQNVFSATPAPSTSQMLMGGGLGLLGASNLRLAEGGSVPGASPSAGLADLAVYEMGW